MGCEAAGTKGAVEYLYFQRWPGLQPRAVTSPASGADAVERARRGDVSAWSQLYAQHHRQVARQLNFLVPRTELEDVLQEVFIEVFRSIRSFEGKSAFTTWLYRLTVHVAMKARRKKTRARLDVVEDVPEQPDEGPKPDEVSLSAERQARVEALLEKLAPKKRAVLVLHDLQGVDAARIAELVGSNILTVRTRLFYARREFEALAKGDPALAEFFEDAREETPSPMGRGRGEGSDR